MKDKRRQERKKTMHVITTSAGRSKRASTSNEKTSDVYRFKNKLLYITFTVHTTVFFFLMNCIFSMNDFVPPTYV